MRSKIFVLAIAVACLIPLQAAAEDIVVAVMDFDDTSGQQLHDIGPAAHEILNAYLVGLPGVRAVSMQLVDLGTAELVFAKVYDLEVKDFYPNASSAPYQNDAKERDLLAQLVEKASPELQASLGRQSGVPQAAPTVRVRFSTEPAGADIEVNGLYIGSTPAELALDEGVQVVTLSRQGYEIWTKKVKVTPGLAIAVNLAPLPPDQKILIETRQGNDPPSP